MFPEFVRDDVDRIEVVNTTVIDGDNPDIGVTRAEQPPQQIQAWTVAAVLSNEHSARGN